MNLIPSCNAKALIKGIAFGIASGAAALAQQNPAPASPPAETTEQVVQMSNFVVQSSKDDGYFAKNSLAGTRANERIIDIPQDLEIVNRQLITDLPDDASTDIMKYGVAGIDRRSTDDDDMFIRGERQLGRFIDGVQFGDTINFPMYDVDRIEVIKGPSALLFGQASATGGLVNYVTKSPSDQPAYALTATFGSNDLYRGQFDATGPIPNTHYRYRLTLEDTDQTRGPRQFDFFKDYLVSGSVDIAPNPNTYIRFDYKNYYVNNVRSAIGINPVTGQFGTLFLPGTNILWKVPRDFSYYEPWVKDPTWDQFYDLKLVNTIIPDLQIQQILTYHSTNEHWDRINSQGNPTAAGNLNRQFQDVRISNRAVNYYVDGLWTLKAGILENKLLFGASLIGSDGRSDSDSLEIAPLNIFAPNYSLVAQQPNVNYGGPNPGGAGPGATYTRSWQYQAYVEDDLSAFNDRFIFVIGERYNEYYTNTWNGITHVNTDLHAEKPIHRIGVIVKPIPSVSLYYNYSESFIFNAGTISNDTGTNGQPLLPSLGKNNEVGAKVETSDGRLFGTFSYFDLTLTNVRVLYTEPDGYLAIGQAGGDNNHGGVEFNLGTSLPSPLGKTQAIVTLYHGNTLNNSGLRPNSVVNQTWSAIVSQSVDVGPLRGLRGGAGVFYKGDLWGVGPSTGAPGAYLVPSYYTTTAFLAYRHGHYLLNLSGENLTNQFFYDGAEDTWWIYSDPGRILHFSVTYNF